MNITTLALQTYVKINNINQPTDFLSSSNFVVLNQKVIAKYGLSFSAFMGALFTKYQGLMKSDRFMQKEVKEFWYTELDSKRDTGLSYYMRKKCIKIGEELGIWSCEAKYNEDFPGIINKTDHFLIDWDKVALFFRDIDKVEDDQDAEEQNQDQAKEDLIKELEERSDQDIEITDKDIEKFADDMANQPGVKNPKTYRLTILQKYFNDDKKTKDNLLLWLKAKNKQDELIDDFEEKYLYYKDSWIYYQNEKYFIKGMFDKDEKIVVKLENETDQKSRNIITVRKEKYEYFIECVYKSNVTVESYRNYDDRSVVNE